MDLALAWLLLPAALGVLAIGWGALIELVAGARLGPALLAPLGFAALVVVGGFFALADATAELALPVAVAGALAGLIALARRPRRRPSAWGLAALGAVFAVYAAPIVASGEATFAGYIRLDDTATWLAFTDHLREHGRDLEGLGPSTYEATLALNVGEGYPLGGFVVLALGAGLVPADVAWLIQPYMAWIAVLLAAALWSLARPLVASAPARAAVAFVAAQPALLFGYYLWGGVKELTAAALLATLAAGLAFAARHGFSVRALVPAALACGALLGVLSEGAAIWLLPPVALAAIAAVRALPVRVAVARATAGAAIVAVFALPVLAVGGLRPPTSSPLDDAEASGNLIGPLEAAQVAGIWPSGDFRLEPDAEALAYGLIAVVVLAAGVGIAAAWRRRALGPLCFAVGSLTAAVVIWALGSPWVDGKALATASPAIVFAALCGALGVAGRARGQSEARIAAVAVASLVAAGVVWSNALAYRDVSLAPRQHLAELERIGELIEGEGPTLITEYQPYGARHFLRTADPEAVSELRRRRIPLRDGRLVPKGEAADTDALDPAALFAYRTLVLRRTPAQSRPPAAYRLLWRGAHYEAWQRSPAAFAAPRRLPLGDEVQPVGRPECAQVAELAAQAPPGRRLVAAARPAVAAVSLADAVYPRAWAVPGAPGAPIPTGPGTVRARAVVPESGAWEVWLGGSVRPRVELEIDGEPVSAVRHELNNGGGYVRLGEADLARGAHAVAIRFGGRDLAPGSGGAAPAIGPLVLSPANPETDLLRIEPERARLLCGRAWDWIELGA